MGANIQAIGLKRLYVTNFDRLWEMESKANFDESWKVAICKSIQIGRYTNVSIKHWLTKEWDVEQINSKQWTSKCELKYKEFASN